MATATAVAPTSPFDPVRLTITDLLPGQIVVILRNVGSRVERKAGEISADGSGVAVRDDHFYPLGTAVSYQVYNSNETTLLAESNEVLTPDSTHPIVRDTYVPGLLSVPVIIVDVTARTRGGRVATYRVVGQTYPVTIGDVRQASEGTLTLYCRSHAERDATIATLSTGYPCALRVPSDCRKVVDDMYFTPLDIGEERYGRHGANILTVGFVETGAPDFPPIATVTYAVQTENADDATLDYAALTTNFLGHTYVAMYLSPTGISP